MFMGNGSPVLRDEEKKRASLLEKSTHCNYTCFVGRITRRRRTLGSVRRNSVCFR